MTRRRSGLISLGLSPRMRGNRSATGSPSACSGSIPAHAGEPIKENHGGTEIWVYPRACGGTEIAKAEASVDRGLSPRMRGNPPSRRRP